MEVVIVTGYSPECREYGEQVRALCCQLLDTQASERLGACGGLIMLAPGDRDLADFLCSERRADLAALFSISLRLDVAVRAVRELAAELYLAKEDWQTTWNDQRVFGRLNALIFGEPGKGPDGIACRLYDSTRYRRSKRRVHEQRLIELLDESLQRRDDAIREEAFSQLQRWAVRLCQQRCGDIHLAHDLVSEAILHLLNTAAPTLAVSNSQSSPVTFPASLGNFLPVSGVEILSRMYVSLFGHQSPTRSQPGLLEKHLANVSALREVPWEEANAARLYGPLSEVGDHPPETLSPQQICEAFNIFRDELDEKRSDGEIGPKSAQALNVILDHVKDRLLATHLKDDDGMVVVNVRLRPHIETDILQPYLVSKLGIKRPKSLLHRVMAVADVLRSVQLYDRQLSPLPIHHQDLSKVLDRLRSEIRGQQFRREFRQRQTLEALIEFWDEANHDLSTGQISQTAICLPKLLSWTKIIHVDDTVIQVLRDTLGMDGTAAHNCVKRQLELLDNWGLVKEYRDG